MWPPGRCRVRPIGRVARRPGGPFPVRNGLVSLTPESLPGDQPSEVASCPFGDPLCLIDDVARRAAISFPSAPILHRDAALLSGFFHVAPLHPLPDQREPGA